MNNKVKAKFDRVFSEYIRLRDSDENGYCFCISCNTLGYYKLMDAGHFVNRKHMSLRYDEINVNTQCRACNRFDEGNIPSYALMLQKRHGNDIIEKLLVMKHTICKMSDSDAELLIKHYREEIKRMKSVKKLRN